MSNNLTNRSQFIVFEGIDCSGKSTMIQAVKEEFEAAGITVMLTREPGGTNLAEAIRSLVLSNAYNVDEETELLLFFAARCHHTKSLIRPVLEGGENIILCDRYVDSSLAYQSRTKEELYKNLDWSNQFDWLLKPDHTVYLQLDPEISSARRLGRNKESGEVDDRIEKSLKERVNRVHQNFETLATIKHYDVIDASKDMDQVRKDVLQLCFGYVGDIEQVDVT